MDGRVTGGVMDDEIKLTKREERAIKRLQKLADTWPQSLMLFSQSGNLVVMKPPKDDPSNPLREYVVDEIYGIPNDGGDF